MDYAEIGNKYNFLTVLARCESKPGSKSRLVKVLAKCDCGVEKEFFMSNIRNGNSKSCGCHRKQVLAEKFKGRHSSNSREYVAWQNMRQRCLNPLSSKFSSYGGRGITICESWSNFENFMNDMGECPDNLTLERLDNDAGYCPENCVWADRKRQSLNRRNSLTNKR
jgi:hypothetical protein